MANPSYRSAAKLLKKPNVRNIVFAYLVTYLGTAMAPIAMAFGVLEATGSTKDMSIVMAAATIATISVLLVGGAIADRSSRQKVIVVAESCAMVIQGIIAILFLADMAQVGWLALLMFLNGIALGFNAPATMGLIIQLVPKEDLQTLNSVLGIARNTSMIAGAALGGLLVSIVGAGWTIAVDAFTFGLSALLIFRLKPSAQVQVPKDSIFQQLKMGWRVFSSHTWLWVIVLQFAFVLSAYQAVLNVLGPAVTNDFYQGSRSWGWIMASLSVGLFVGGFVGIRYQPKYPLRVATFCVFSAALIPIAFSVPVPLLVCMLAAFVNGICWELFGIFWVSTLQKKIAPEMLSRVSAYDYIGSIGLVPIGLIVVGFLYESIGFRAVSIGAAALILVSTLAVLFVGQVWKMRASDA